MNMREESIGSTLAEARRAAGLTVAQLSARTRIREALISAIERDDFSLCGGDFYARGHVRNIARAVGLDSEAAVALLVKTHTETAPPPGVFPAPIKLRERRSLNWSMALGIALVIVVIFGVMRVMGGGGERRAAEVRPADVASTIRPPEQRARSPRPPAAAPVHADMVEVRVVAKQTSWLRVHDAKGRRLFTGTLRPGQTSTWTARQRIRLEIGNAGGVTLRVNGEDLGAPGRPGQVVRRSFGPATGTTPSARPSPVAVE